jgi:hypothetical protein
MNHRLSYSEAASAVSSSVTFSRDQNCLALQISKKRAPVYTRVGIVVLAILALGQPANPQARNSFDGFALVDKSGNIRKPTDNRDLYQTLGTYFVLDPKGGNQMHLTYASPGAADYYWRNKKFADGTVLVKEVFGTDHAQMTRAMPTGRTILRSGSS